MERSKPNYTAIARKYRPQTFIEVLGQDAVVTTLKNALLHDRMAHAYLFSGSRGTGKTTLARLLAKALNCSQRGDDGEPCNTCSSCKEITQGSSMDVLEIDGASHRGIEDMRQINETVGYAPAGGHFKIYIVDEVHMLTKEAFNALLKTLEEPPSHVKFFFATTEPHKVLPTVLSRCQQFQLNRLPSPLIATKLEKEARDLDVTITEEALFLISQMAEGGMRDAESLLDQVISFHGDTIDATAVSDVLGLMPRDAFFRLDEAAKEEHLLTAVEVADEVFSRGKNLTHFLDNLIAHYRNRLLLLLAPSTSLPLAPEEIKQYQETNELYSKDQLVTLLDTLIEAQASFKAAPSKRLALEMILMRVIRTPQRLPVEALVKRLTDLEATLQNKMESGTSTPKVAPPALPIEKPQPKATPPKPQATPPPPPTPKAAPPPPTVKAPDGKTQSRYDTVLRFAAVELEGTLE